MTKNSRLVEYFMSEFYSDKTTQLAHIAATNFEFQINNNVKRNFEAYAKSKILMINKAEFTYGRILNNDDEHFIFDWELCMIDKNRKKICGIGNTKLTIRDGLLYSVHATYDNEDAFFKLYVPKSILVSEEHQ